MLLSTPATTNTGRRQTDVHNIGDDGFVAFPAESTTAETRKGKEQHTATTTTITESQPNKDVAANLLLRRIPIAWVLRRELEDAAVEPAKVVLRVSAGGLGDAVGPPFGFDLYVQALKPDGRW